MAEDRSIHKAEAFAPAIGVHDQSALDKITEGLEGMEDSKVQAANEYLQVLENIKNKPSVNWPNKDNQQMIGMAEGLRALDELGASKLKDV